MIVEIIKLLWNGKKFNYGIHLNKYKNIILQNLVDLYKKPASIEKFEANLFEMKEFGDVFRTLKYSGFVNVEYIYDFFVILHDEKKITEILNKIFFKNIVRKIIKKINMNELIENIKNSDCLEKNSCNYSKLKDYIESLDKLNKIESNEHVQDIKKPKRKKHKNKKTKKFQFIEETEEKSNDIKSNENNSSINQQTEEITNDKNFNNILDSNEDNDNSNNSNIINEPPKESFLINYFKKMKEYYDSKKMETIILSKLIKGEKITIDLFTKKASNNDWIIDQHYKNLKRIVDILNNEKMIEDEINKQLCGYICLKYNKYYLEGIYATIPNRLLLKEISDNEKFIKDNFDKENVDIVHNCFRIRGLSFEYFINKIIIDNLELEPLPRVFFWFKSPNSNMEYEELDGVFYCKGKKKLDTKLFPFIEEDIYKMNKNNKFEFEAHELGSINFDDKTLILIKIRNRFPNNKETNDEYIGKEFKALLIKSIHFYSFYSIRCPFINKIKILFFYDSVRKGGYDSYVNKIFKNLFSNYRNKKLEKLIEFQIIFIKPSYFSIGFAN